MGFQRDTCIFYEVALQSKWSPPSPNGHQGTCLFRSPPSYAIPLLNLLQKVPVCRQFISSIFLLDICFFDGAIGFDLTQIWSSISLAISYYLFSLTYQNPLKRRGRYELKPWTAAQNYQIYECIYVYQVICPKSHSKYVMEWSFDLRWHGLHIWAVNCNRI